jgi:hypothetical protein
VEKRGCKFEASPSKVSKNQSQEENTNYRNKRIEGMIQEEECFLIMHQAFGSIHSTKRQDSSRDLIKQKRQNESTCNKDRAIRTFKE